MNSATHRQDSTDNARRAVHGTCPSAGWVDSVDALPGTRRDVLVYRNKRQEVAHYTQGEWWPRGAIPTHWRDLPDDPPNAALSGGEAVRSKGIVGGSE